MELRARVHAAAVQWAVVAGLQLPVSVVVVRHHVDEVQVTGGRQKSQGFNNHLSHRFASKHRFKTQLADGALLLSLKALLLMGNNCAWISYLSDSDSIAYSNL